MVSTLTTSGVCLLKAGAGVSGVQFKEGTGQSNWNTLIELSESYLNASTKVNWIPIYGGMTASVREILNDIVSSKAANEAVKWDMAGYSSRQAAEDIISINLDTVDRGINLLKDADTIRFLEDSA